jgi:hypothetical protein
MNPTYVLLVVKPDAVEGAWIRQHLPENAYRLEESSVPVAEAAKHVRILTGSLMVLRALHGATNPPRKLCLHFISSDPERLGAAGKMPGVEVMDMRLDLWKARLQSLAVGALGDEAMYNRAA